MKYVIPICLTVILAVAIAFNNESGMLLGFVLWLLYGVYRVFIAD